MKNAILNLIDAADILVNGKDSIDKMGFYPVPWKSLSRLKVALNAIRGNKDEIEMLMDEAECCRKEIEGLKELLGSMKMQYELLQEIQQLKAEIELINENMELCRIHPPKNCETRWECNG